MANRLLSLRLMEKKTREEMALILGLSTTAVWQFENDRKTPSLETYTKYHDHFGVSYDFLLDKEAITLIEKIKKIMDDNQLTPKDLAESVGKKTDEIIDIFENGAEPTEELLSLISMRYDLPENYLRKEDPIVRDKVKVFSENPENWEYILLAMGIKERNLKTKDMEDMMDYVLRFRRS